MDISLFGRILIADATSEELKMALVENGRIAKTINAGRAMEHFFEALGECTGGDFAGISAFVLCTGTGSVLGTRTASVSLSTIAQFTGAQIFQFNCMEVGALYLSEKIDGKFTLLTQSRKGYANILNYDGGIKLLKEITVDQIDSTAHPRRLVLRQRAKADPALAKFETFELDALQTAQTLLKNPKLAAQCSQSPDAKPLTEREYVKWKAQAHI